MNRKIFSTSSYMLIAVLILALSGYPSLSQDTEEYFSYPEFIPQVLPDSPFTAACEIIPVAEGIKAMLSAGSIESSYAVRLTNTLIDAHTYDIILFIGLPEDRSAIPLLINSSMDIIFRFLAERECIDALIEFKYKDLEKHPETLLKKGFNYKRINGSPLLAHLSHDTYILPGISFSLIRYALPFPQKIRVLPLWISRDTLYVPLEGPGCCRDASGYIYDSVFEKGFSQSKVFSLKIRNEYSYLSFIESRLNALIQELKDNRASHAYAICMELMSILKTDKSKNEDKGKNNIPEISLTDSHRDYLYNFPKVLLEVISNYPVNKCYFESSYFQKHIQEAKAVSDAFGNGPDGKKLTGLLMYMDYYIRKLKDSDYDNESFKKYISSFSHFSRMLSVQYYRDIDLNSSVISLLDLLERSNIRIIFTDEKGDLFSENPDEDIEDLIIIDRKTRNLKLFSRKTQHITLKTGKKSHPDI